MAYAWKKWYQARRDLLDRLNVPHDSSGFWSDAEAGVYLTEALRTWNAVASFNRTQDTFVTVAGTAFYDLTTALASSSLEQTATDLTIQQAVLYHLIEPPTAEWYAGSEMTTGTIARDALERARNNFLLETGAYLTRATTPVTAPITGGRVTLADTVIDVRRAAYNSSPLHRIDEWAADYFSPTWLTPGSPLSYSVYLAPHVGLTVIPPPAASATLDLVTVNTGPSLLSPPFTPGGTLLGVPDDWSWVVKWGELATLLSASGEIHDDTRAAYCAERYATGCKMARMTATVMNAVIGASVLATTTLHELDCYAPTWQSSSGTPTQLAMGGLNLAALNPVPSGIVTVTVDVVSNAPIPASDTAFVQIGREQWEAVLDYAVHLAAFKQGGAEFMATIPLAQNFLTLAMANNDRLRAWGRDYSLLQGIATKNEQQVPRVTPQQQQRQGRAA